MWNINAPQGRSPCAIFIKFAEFVPSFRMHYANDTRSRNRRQKTGVSFWRFFLTAVAKFLAPETNIATVLLVG